MRHCLLVPFFLALMVLTPRARAEDKAPPPAAPAPAEAPPPAAVNSTMEDLAKQLADSQDKLATALHSYSQLTDENSQLKADAEKNAAEKAALTSQLEDAQRAIAALKIGAAVAEQVDGLRTQLRQSQNQIADLATENADLRTRLTLVTAPPVGSSATPSRPGGAITVAAAPVARPATAAAAPAPGTPRSYTVAEGDSLSKISRKFYGTPNRWPEIVAANRAGISEGNNIRVGMKLVIP